MTAHLAGHADFATTKRYIHPKEDTVRAAMERARGEKGGNSGDKMAETPSVHPAVIAAMWRYTRNNGIPEGFHNKMKLINRQAYGFRNFENYRMRVKVLCS